MRSCRYRCWWLALLAALLPVGPVQADPARPNLVVLIGDDHGYPYAGFMGDRVVQTPHLDRLAAGGTVFTTGYSTASVCRPALMSLLTGLAPLQVDEAGRRLEAKGRPQQDANRVLDYHTLPRLLGEHGYTSFQAGKHWEATAAGAGFSAGTRGRKVQGKGLERMSGGRSGLAVGRSTLAPVWRFLDEHGEGPFLLWLAPMLPHGPMDAGEALRERYAGQPLSASALAYYANITRLDEVVGRLVARLEEEQLLERTVIVYVSDNGWDQAPGALHTGPRGSHLGGPRGKLSMYELGFRTPIVFHAPGRAKAGVVRDELVSILDLFPTLLDYAGVPVPPRREGRSLRGAVERGEPLAPRNLYGAVAQALPISVGPERADWRAQRGPAVFARTPRWHYFVFEAEGAAPHLYDLQADPEEQKNLAEERPEVARRLRAELEAWRAEVRAAARVDR